MSLIAPARTLDRRGQRDAPRRLRIPALVCAVVAFLNAACWSIVTPPFQAPDEADHYAYVQQLAENQRLPERGATSSELSREEAYTLLALHHQSVRFLPQGHTIASVAEQHVLEHAMSVSFPGGASLSAGIERDEPPLYYALETVPYTIASAGTVLDRLQLMRLASSLLAGLTALMAFLFVREVLPRARWAWVVGGLCVALMPLLGFISGAVNPDAMLIPVSAAAFYMLARSFRRGLTTRRSLALGLVTMTGFLTKLNFVGLAPGVVFGVLLLSGRLARTSPRLALRSLGVFSAIAGAPVLVYVLVNLVSGHPALGAASTAFGLRGSILNEISYVWQLYLPKLPGMASYFPHLLMTRVWFDAFVGLYGWIDTVFPAWACSVALAPAALIAGLAVRALVARRLQLRSHLPQIAVFAAMAVGLTILVGATSYVAQVDTGEGAFLEPRYFLPLLPLLAVTLALAALGAGRRWGRATGASLIVLFLAWDLFSQLQVVARYYG